MSGYTVEIRTGILTDVNKLHTWLQITHPDGTKEAWGFHPKEDSLGKFIYGDGEVRPELADAPYTATSGPISMRTGQNSRYGAI